MNGDKLMKSARDIQNKYDSGQKLGKAGFHFRLASEEVFY
jgi:hypothetical protein